MVSIVDNNNCYLFITPQTPIRNCILSIVETLNTIDIDPGKLDVGFTSS